MITVIPGLRQSPVYQVSADLYRRHHPHRHDRHGQPDTSSSGYVGYALGGRGNRLPPEGFAYDRDPEP